MLTLYKNYYLTKLTLYYYLVNLATSKCSKYIKYSLRTCNLVVFTIEYLKLDLQQAKL
jgi:hypothetical protein